MKGRIPKPPGQQQHRSPGAGARTFQVDEPVRKRAPSLPRGREWHPLTTAWWRDVWASELAVEYLRVDVHGLYRLAVLVDEYWLRPTKELAAEIRLQQSAYGLSPVDRRRLQWTIERADKGRRRPPPKPEVGDPRGYLRPVK